MIGQYSYELGRMGEAQRAFEDAIQSGGLLPDDVDNMNVVVAQLMIGNGQYREGAERLESYLRSGGEEKPQYIELLVNGWVQTEDFDRALPWAEKWFNTAKPKARKHYDMMNFLYSHLGMADDQIRLIKDMIDLWPSDKHLWQIWSSILANNGRDAEAFEVYQMMYQAGLLTDEDDLFKVVQYYDFYDMPFEAANFLEREMEAQRISDSPENLQQTAYFFRSAREPERAIPFLTRAAKLSDDIDLNVELGEALSESGACKDSEAAFKTAIGRGYDRGKAQMLIGSCYFDQYAKFDRLSCSLTNAQIQNAPRTLSRKSALNAFKSVPKKSRQSGDAKKWTQFIEAEIEADDRRCEFVSCGGRDVTKELCYQKIKQAYDAAIFTNGFQLDDKSCKKFVPDYDAAFRISAPPE